jgi:hypothetical protein
VTKTFAELIDAVEPDDDGKKLRRIRVHDLRHGAASLLLASGADMALVSKRLGHSSISVTTDTYSHLLDGVGRQAANQAAALVPRKRDQRDQTTGPDDQSVTTRLNRRVAVHPERRKPPRSELVRRQGLEPRTRWLRASCSAN